MSNKSYNLIKNKYPYASRDSLIPILQDLQESEGCLSRESIRQIGKYLQIPTSKIYGVATFYNQFRLQPRGKFHFTVCRGTACHVKGSIHILKMLTEQLGINPGETSRDRLYSLETVACMGACGLAPVVNLNGEFHAGTTPKKLVNIIRQCRERELGNEAK